MEYLIGKLMVLPGILIALSFHEYAHAKVAYMLGDSTAKDAGRVTINPFKHIEIVGFLMLMLAGFGWGKPVPINSNNFKKQRRDDILVSAAGVTMNFLLAILFAFIINLFYKFAPEFSVGFIGSTTISMMTSCIFINIVLMIFNLIPIPPLDGFNILAELTRLVENPIFYKIYSKGPIILLLLVITNVTDHILMPGIDAVYNFINYLMGIIF